LIIELCNDQSQDRALIRNDFFWSVALRIQAYYEIDAPCVAGAKPPRRQTCACYYQTYRVWRDFVSFQILLDDRQSRARITRVSSLAVAQGLVMAISLLAS